MGNETEEQRFDRIVSRDDFRRIKPILESIATDRKALMACVKTRSTYEELLVALGYSLQIEHQIDPRDYYPKVGPEHGVKAVLPWLDLNSHKTLTTIVKLDSTVITTPDAIEFFDRCFGELREQFGT